MPNKCFIRENKDKILVRWEILSREMFPSASDKSRVAVRDHLPQLTDALCDVIESGVFEKPETLGESHGRQRFSFGDYTLSQVMEEYWLLKKVIMDELEKENQIVMSHIRLINHFFESAATSAACEFSNLSENKLRHLVHFLEISNQDLERFSAVAAHDLRSPVATIIGYSDLIMDDIMDDHEDLTSNVQVIKTTSQRMLSLIDQLLEYTKVGKSVLAKQVFSLEKAAQNAVDNLKKQFADANAQIRIEDLPQMMGDEILFSQLFQNLIANSLKFKSNQRPCLITVRGRQVNDRIYISVKDNGMGFDPSLNQEIFEPFKRGNNIRNIKGSGLGLATVKKIVDLHGGTVLALGRVDEGAEFNIEVPRVLS